MNGQVTRAKEPPDPDKRWWWPNPFNPNGPHNGPYRVTDEFEDLPDGGRAQVVEFDG